MMVRPRTRWLVLTVMCVGYFLVLLDVTVINVTLPEIGRGLGASVPELQWVVDGYALVLAAVLLIGGTTGDIRGHKPIVLTGMAVFGAASVACGSAPSISFLIAGRLVQGLGAALLLPGTLAVISRSFPEPSEQARAIGVWAGVGAAALPTGPLLGGLLVQGPGWRWVFFLNVPIVLVAGAAAVRTVAPDVVGVAGRLDLAGLLLGAVALSAATFSVIEAGRAGLSAAAMVSVVIGLLALAGFLRVEHTADCPMLPLHLFRGRAFSTVNCIAAIMNLGTLGMLFLLTLYLQIVQHRSALSAGVAVLPLFLPLSVLGPLAGRVTAQHGPRPMMATGLLLAATGVALSTTWSARSSYPRLLPALLGWGIGLALLTPAVVAAAIAAAPSDRSGLASGVNNTARQTGGVIGIAAYGAIAGPPARVNGFVSGLHTAGAITAGLFVLAAGAVALIPARASQEEAGHVR